MSVGIGFTIKSPPICVMELDAKGPADSYEYKLLKASGDISTMREDLRREGEAGFEFAGMSNRVITLQRAADDKKYSRHEF